MSFDEDQDESITMLRSDWQQLVDERDRYKAALEKIAYISMSLPMAAGADDSTKMQHYERKAFQCISISSNALTDPPPLNNRLEKQ